MVGITTDSREEKLPRREEEEGRSRFFGGVDLNRARGDWEDFEDRKGGLMSIGDEELDKLISEAMGKIEEGESGKVLGQEKA